MTESEILDMKNNPRALSNKEIVEVKKYLKETEDEMKRGASKTKNLLTELNKISFDELEIESHIQ